MLKFFRKIRQNLLSEGKTGKYLKYAFGEIVLVVIGILIALQINTWNEARKSNRLANEIYTNLLTSLKQDSVEVQRAIDLLTKSLNTQKTLILNETDELPKELSQEELDQLVGEVSIGVMSFFPKTGVYELITSNNSMDLLKSAEIKSLLINLYDFQYKRYENVDAVIDSKYHQELNALIREKIKFVLTFDSNSEFVILHHADPLLFNQHYHELVSECRDVYGALSTGNNYLIQIKESINELSGLIRKELKK